jgi:hypothetical protein
MKCGDRVRGVALGNDIARASFALTTLGRNAQFELDFVKAHPGARMASDFTVRDATADTDDHGGTKAGWLVNESEVIINTNSSHLQ